jgi:gluconolactonase
MKEKDCGMAVEAVAPGFDRLVSPTEEFEWLGSGYGATREDGWRLGVAEGPVWFRELNCLFFSDNANSKRYKWCEEEGVTLHRDGTNNANGLARDLSGRLIACEHDSRRVTREEPDGSITVVADSYRGAPLNRPNDVTVKSDGSIYFTDPISLGVDSVLDIAGVYRVAPDLGRINLLVHDFALPNGLCLSPDEKILYVNDTYREHIRAFNFEGSWNTWRLNLGSDRVFCDMSGDTHPGHPDGMKVDSEGNVWCTGPGGVWVIDPDGQHVGTILCPEDKHHITNFCFGGEDLTTLFVTTPTAMGRIRVKVAGFSR